MSDPVLKAYAIFDGGGVLGAALAGALKAAEQDIDFQGFGGTSADSIVATLAAAGYTGAEIQKILIDTDFTTMLAERGRTVEGFRDQIAKLRVASKNGLWGIPEIFWRIWTIYGMVRDELGVDDGRELRGFLLDRIRERWRDEIPGDDVNFAQF